MSYLFAALAFVSPSRPNVGDTKTHMVIDHGQCFEVLDRVGKTWVDDQELRRRPVVMSACETKAP